VDFAGEKGLHHEKFENFGTTGSGHCESEISKKVFYDYLVENRMTNDSFEDFFPREKRKAFNQIFCFDLDKLKSGKSEILTVACEFSGTIKSPRQFQASKKLLPFILRCTM
jgi:hypothetical protein